MKVIALLKDTCFLKKRKILRILVVSILFMVHNVILEERAFYFKIIAEILSQTNTVFTCMVQRKQTNFSRMSEKRSHHLFNSTVPVFWSAKKCSQTVPC